MEVYLESLTPDEKRVLEIVKITFDLKTEKDIHEYIKNTIGYTKYLKAQKQSEEVKPPPTES